jgi:protein arginine N-methyltransferase 1
MYSVANYSSMIADHARMEAYVRALRQAVNPDSVVLDIGAGTGIFAMLACQFGARRVYAIEPDDAIQVAREIAAANGCADRIEFIQDLSTNVTLPERADVIISDLRGVLPLFQQHIPSIVDARQRLLAPGGVLIPQRDTLWAAVVDAADLYAKHTAPWGDGDYGLDLQAVQRIVANTWRKGRVTPEQILLSPQPWATLDYATITETNLSGEAAWTVERAGTAHGLAVWFDATLADGIHFSNAPGETELIYGSAFFPLIEPVSLSPGDRAQVKIKADLVEDDYIWSWSTSVFASGDDRKAPARFDQSTFFGAPLSPGKLRKKADSYAPRLNEDGLIDRYILDLMSNELTQGEIARRVTERYPRRFKDWRAALTRVATLSSKYSE